MSSGSKVEYQKKEIPSRVQTLGLILTVLGLIVVLGGYFVNPARMAFNNIIGLTFIISIAVGALFFVAVEYLSGAVWSTPFQKSKRNNFLIRYTCSDNSDSTLVQFAFSISLDTSGSS